LHSELVESREGKETEAVSMESPIYRVPELTKMIRIVGDHVKIKFRFSFVHESIAEMALFSRSRPIKL